MVEESFVSAKPIRRLGGGEEDKTDDSPPFRHVALIWRRGGRRALAVGNDGQDGGQKRHGQGTEAACRDGCAAERHARTLLLWLTEKKYLHLLLVKL